MTISGSADEPPNDAAIESRVLVVPPTRADGVALEKLFRLFEAPSKILPDIPALVATLREGGGVAIVSEESVLRDSEILAAHLDAQPVWSDLPVIVLSRAGTESNALAQRVPRLGNVSVVERPMRTSTFASLVRSGLRARAKQYEVRAHLHGLQSAQREIRQGEQRYRGLIENLTDYAVFMIDAEGRVISWNDAAEAMLGFSESEVLGLSGAVLGVAHAGGEDAYLNALKAVGDGERAAVLRPFIRRDGAEMMIEEVVTAARDEREQLLGYGVFLRDVTAQHRAEADRERLLVSERAARAEAERSGRMKDEFLATLSHELRTPLSAILGWAQVLRRTPALTADIGKGLTVIERNARAQAQIIEDLLDMSAVVSGKVRLQLSHVNLGMTVEAAINTIRPAAQAKGIHMQVALDAEVHTINGDADRLQQVFWNLLSNAVKFTAKGGRVSVELRQANSHVEVIVEDSGEGIEPAFLPFVFDRFRQSDASTTRRHGGLGLGLSIVRQLVELHGGTVIALSDGPGLGSLFRVELPLLPTDLHPPSAVESASPKFTCIADAAEASARIDLSGILVLVVDDESDSRALLRRILEDCGARVVVAASAEEAYRVLIEARPGVMVSDIGMPREDGYSLMRRIRSRNDAVAHVPAMALTAYARPEDRRKAMDAGFQVHLTKPVEPDQLLTALANLLQR